MAIVVIGGLLWLMVIFGVGDGGLVHVVVNVVVPMVIARWWCLVIA